MMLIPQQPERMESVYADDVHALFRAAKIYFIRSKVFCSNSKSVAFPLFSRVVSIHFTKKGGSKKAKVENITADITSFDRRFSGGFMK